MHPPQHEPLETLVQIWKEQRDEALLHLCPEIAEQNHAVGALVPCGMPSTCASKPAWPSVWATRLH